MSHQQLILLGEKPNTSAPQTQPNTEAIAASGDRRSANYDPNHFSDAEEDLGGGLHAAHLGELAVMKSKDKPTGSSRRVLSRSKLSSRGKLMADQEPDTSHDPAYSAPFFPDDEQKTEGLNHTSEIRRMLAAQRANRHNIFPRTSLADTPDPEPAAKKDPRTRAIDEQLEVQRKRLRLR